MIKKKKIGLGMQSWITHLRQTWPWHDAHVLSWVEIKQQNIKIYASGNNVYKLNFQRQKIKIRIIWNSNL